MMLPVILILSLLQGQAASSSSMCPSRAITITAVVLPPYVAINNNSTRYGIAYDFINDGIKKCFRSCKLPPVVWNFVNTSSELHEALKTKSTDLALPIVPSVEQMLEDEEDLDDTSGNATYVFEHLVESPGLSLIIHTANFNRKAKSHTANAMLGVWPIIVFCILLAGISGIIVWAMEYQTNRSEFPKNFFSGSYEGFWWAFVSMTTVGYGDKTPKSIIGRFFGVVWILIGLILIGIFTATATTALHAGIAYYSSGIHGKRIGVLVFSEAGSVALRSGAIVTDYTDFEKMHEHLRSDRLDGLLIDRYEASHLLHGWHRNDVLVLENIDTELHYKMVRVVGRNDALGSNICFQGRIKRHARLTQKYVGLYVKPVKGFIIAEHASGFLSPKEYSTKVAAGVIAGILVGLIIIGAIYQFIYRRWIAPKRRKSASHHAKDETIHLHSIVVKELGESVNTLSDDMDVLKEKFDKMQAQEKPAKVEKLRSIRNDGFQNGNE